MSETYTVLRHRIPENIVPGKRLGRHVVHDSRSLRYAWTRVPGRPLVTTEHARRIPILDQGNVGACTGNAETGALGSDPLFGTLSVNTITLNEAFALGLYSAAETIDGDGPYPPNDNGSCGLSVCQAARNMGLISGDVHCLSLSDVQDALLDRALIVGTNWYDSMDSPDSDGIVTISPDATVRGGHEYLARRLDIDRQLVGFDNSWGPSFGEQGSFWYSFDTLARLLSEQGDATVSLPAGTAPVQAPVDHEAHHGVFRDVERMLVRLVRDV